MLKSYTEKDNRFQYYKRPLEHLSGGNGARNYGFAKSKGKYIQWFDSDDVMMPNLVEEKLKPFIKYDNVDVVFSAFENVNAQGERTRIANQKYSGNIIDDLVDGHVSFGPLSFMLRSEILKDIRYDETLKKNQDLDFFFRLFTSQTDLKIVHVDKILYTVIAHEGSMTFGTSRDISKMTSTYRVYLNVLDFFSDRSHTKGVAKYRYHCLNNLKVMLKNGFYSHVIKRLISFRYITLYQKIYLLGCVMSQYLIGRGTIQFVRLIDENPKN